MRWRSRLDKKLAALATATAQWSRERESMGSIESRLVALKQAVALTQGVAARVQSRAHAQIARVVTRCLNSVFDEDYQFKIHFERKRGRTEARLVLVHDGIEVDPTTSESGGVVDVAAFAIRLACLTLTRPKKRLLLVLDEPFHFVRKDNRERVRALLEALARELHVQIVLVTHDSELRAGLVVDLEDAHRESVSRRRRTRRT